MIDPKNLAMIGLLFIPGSLLAQQGAAGRTPIFAQSIGSKPSGLGLRSLDPMRSTLPGLDEQMPEQLRKSGLSSRFILHQKNYDGLSLIGDKRIESAAFSFDLDNVPVCDLEVKIHRTLDGSTLVMGDFPQAPLSSESLRSEQWATQEQINKIVGETLLMASLGTNFRVESQDQCIWSDGARPVWKLTVNVAGLNYEMIADASEVYKFDPKHFFETGEAKVYETNEIDGPAVSIPLREMDATGFLSNPYFQVCLPTSANKVVCKPSEGTALYSFAQEQDWNYNYDPGNDSNKFTQASVFAHTNVALQWLENHGYKNFGNIPIKLLAHAKINGDINNALYQPATSTGTPMILVGDGDNNILQNLGTDADVVSHELGHHVVYSTVTEIRGESLVLHEALADFFTFARTGNACLGESICPDTQIGLQVCAKPKQCLRSAENNYALGDADLPEQAHLKGQFISGLLWDLHVKDGIIQDDITTMVLKTVDLLVSNSGYKHLIVGMLLVDHSEFSDKYCSTILARAKTRGLGTLLSDVSCESVSASNNSKSNVSTFLNKGATSPAGAGTSKKSGTKGCGVLNAGGGSGQVPSLLLILSLPVAITWIRRKKS